MATTQPKYRQDLTKVSNQRLIELLLSTNGRPDYSIKTITALLRDCGNKLSDFVALSVDEGNTKSSIKEVDYLRIRASIELSDRCRREAQVDSTVIQRSQDVYQLFSRLEALKYEQFWVIVLNTANRVQRQIKISEGGISATVVDQKKIFKEVIDSYGSGIILVHNHPSGNAKPSESDISITRKIVEAAKLFDIKVLDHLIITSNCYFSFSDNSMF